MVIDGPALARFVQHHAHPPPDPTSALGRSVRNRFVGLVTKIDTVTVMTQVELPCGPHRVAFGWLLLLLGHGGLSRRTENCGLVFPLLRSDDVLAAGCWRGG
jgi:hypothetical protein